jgi:hypothetical protein
VTITPQHRQAAARVAALLEARLAAKSALSPRPWTPLETAFYAALLKLLAGESQALAEMITQSGPAAVDNLPWWQTHEAAMVDELAHNLGQVARLGAVAGREAIGAPRLGVNWGLVNRQAADWAEQHAAELVRQVEPATRLALRQAVADWSASGQPLGALAERIRDLSDPVTGQVFGPARARRIAQTESTSAYAAGNVLAWGGGRGAASGLQTGGARELPLLLAAVPDGGWGDGNGLVHGGRRTRLHPEHSNTVGRGGRLRGAA